MSEKLTDAQVAALAGTKAGWYGSPRQWDMRDGDSGVLWDSDIRALALEVQQARLLRKVLGVLLVNGADAGVSKEALLSALRFTLDPDADFTPKEAR